MANEELIQALTNAVMTDPRNSTLRKHLADLLAASGRLVDAINEYRTVLNLQPGDGETKAQLAKAYLGLNKPEVALVVLEDLLRAETSPAPEILMLAARLYLQTGSPAQAVEVYQKAVARDPALADAELEKQLPLSATPPGTAPSPALPVRPARVTAEAEEDLSEPTLTDREALSSLEKPRVTFKDVGGMDKLKENIRLKIIYPIQRPELYQAYGKKAGGGILMYGPPGCGKTYLARATAGEVQANFIPVGLHDVLNMYLGQSEQNLHALFETARQHTPCVLFFDEVDAMGANRSDMRYSAMRVLINQFLSELDGVDSSNEGVLLLAATNAPWHIDPALRRPGRFDRVIFVPPPDAAAREAILKILLTGKLVGQVDCKKIARLTEGFSGADLKGLVDQAVEEKLRDAMLSGTPRPLCTQDIEGLIKTTAPTVKEWFATARNYAIYSNEGGIYNDILDYLKLNR